MNLGGELETLLDGKAVSDEVTVSLHFDPSTFEGESSGNNNPVTCRQHGAMGPANVLPFKSATEVRIKRNFRKCGYCGLPGHTYNGSCDLRKTMGNCVPETQID